MFLEVVKAKYMEGYKILLGFNNGIYKEVDLKDELLGEIFEPLKNVEFFKSFKISFNTIEWENGADFAPEFLFEIGKTAQLAS